MDTEQEVRQIVQSSNVCVLIPTYNNEKTLKGIIDGALKQISTIVVVDDGSTDSTSKILDSYTSLIVIRHPFNLGKGSALQSGFSAALSAGFDYTITIDSDGQHDPNDIPVFIQALAEHGPCIIIGKRNMNQDGIPAKSSFGHKFSNFWFRLETGIDCPDTQSGFRLYPLGLLQDMRFYTRKFEFEIEVLVRAAWRGIKVVSVPVSVRYFNGLERVTHFRPMTDFTRISILNTFLVLLTVAYHYPKRLIRGFKYRKHLAKIKSDISGSSSSPMNTSLSIAMGVFMGIAPLWGFQMIGALTLAFIMKLNKPLVILSANISVPPMIPFIIFLSYKTGAIWFGEEAIELDFSKSIGMNEINLNLKQYIVGSLILAGITSFVCGSLTWTLLRIKSGLKQT